MAIWYSLSLGEPHTHLFEVQVRVGGGSEAVELVMPSWTPGSYLLREYARNLQDFGATDGEGRRLEFRKVDKNTWRIEAGDAADVVARYRVYANELSVRTSHLDASHGYVNGASVFMYVNGRQCEEARVTIERPQGWEVTTSLRPGSDGEWVAENYDELVDCPIEIGSQRVIEWEQEGVPHRYAFWGPTGGLDEAQLLADTKRVIDVCSKMFGGLPYDRYLFLVHVGPDGRGGLEHRTSTSLLVTQPTLSGEGYESLISLVAHEFFHVWLGKRIRPAPLGPFDYTSENYTRNLWVVEGFTTYYTDRILLLAGLMSPERYLERIGDGIARHQELPGRAHQSLEDSSFDTWIKFYRPDAHSPNSQVSYYQKGALVAMALDLEIRAKWQGTRSLDDVMTELWRRHEVSGGEGFAEAGPGGIQEIVEAVYGASVEKLFEAWVRGVDEIDFDEVMARAGLALKPGTGADVPMRSTPAPQLEPAELSDTGMEEGAEGVAGSAGLLVAMEAAIKADDPEADDETTLLEVGGTSTDGPAGSGSVAGSASAEGSGSAGPGAMAAPPEDAVLVSAAAAEAALAAESAGSTTSAGVPSIYRTGARIIPPSATEMRLGLRLREEAGGRVKVTNVLEGSAAHRGGVNVGDEILAIDGARVRLLTIAAKAGTAREGEEMELLLMRRDEVLTVRVRLGAVVERRARVVWAAESDARRVGAGWLGVG